jgi:DNA-binding LacI/PurR family transcriptional regulator
MCEPAPLAGGVPVMAEQILPTTAAISEIAGVSKSTASRALNNDLRISEKTRTRIWKIAKELGYAPNAIAQSLATQRSRIIAFIGSVEPNYWYQEKIQVLVDAISDSGMQTMIFQVPSGTDISGVVPEMVRYRLAGCIVIPTVEVSRHNVDMLAQYNIPVVLLNRQMRGTHTFSVACDQAAGGRAVAQFLIAGGHERIAFVAGPHTPTAIARESGFVAQIGEMERTLFHRIVGDFTFEGAYVATRKLMASKLRPDAIFAANDLMAFGVLDALRSLGIKVPAEVSVVGFDNAAIAAWPSYRLTTVAQPIQHMFRRAVGLISQRNDSAASIEKAVVIDGELVVRQSARVPREMDAIEIPVRIEC